MSRYQARHRAAQTRPPTGRAGLGARVAGASAALAVLGGGTIAYGSVTGAGNANVVAAPQPLQPSASPDPAAAAVTHAERVDLASQREARTSANLTALVAIGTARAAAEAEARAAADAKAAADQAAAEAQRLADAERAAREAQRQALANSRQDPKAAARAMLGEFGFADSQFSCLDSLWTRESNWSYSATNRSSGAYGIPQSLPASKMASVGADYRTNPETQIRWGLGYIKNVYGTPCGAWGHSQATGWY